MLLSDNLNLFSIVWIWFESQWGIVSAKRSGGSTCATDYIVSNGNDINIIFSKIRTRIYKHCSRKYLSKAQNVHEPKIGSNKAKNMPEKQTFLSQVCLDESVMDLKLVLGLTSKLIRRISAKRLPKGSVNSGRMLGCLLVVQNKRRITEGKPNISLCLGVVSGGNLYTVFMLCQSLNHISITYDWLKQVFCFYTLNQKFISENKCFQAGR